MWRNMGHKKKQNVPKQIMLLGVCLIAVLHYLFCFINEDIFCCIRKWSFVKWRRCCGKWPPWCFHYRWYWFCCWLCWYVIIATSPSTVILQILILLLEHLKEAVGDDVNYFLLVRLISSSILSFLLIFCRIMRLVYGMKRIVIFTPLQLRIFCKYTVSLFLSVFRYDEVWNNLLNYGSALKAEYPQLQVH